MKHAGYCSVEGSEQKSGDLQLSITEQPPILTAALMIDGVRCTFRGHLSDAYAGVLSCPGRRAVPMAISLQ